MKRLIIITFLLSSITAISQTPDDANTKKQGQNEIKINTGAVVFELYELSYERIINQNIGVGCSFAYNDLEGSIFQGYALPYFRFYPDQKREASGFFLEANTGAIFYEETTFEFPASGVTTIIEETKVGFGFGFAVGGKFVSNSGLFGEVYGGLGREFGDETDVDVFPRIGLNFGYRF